MVVNPKIALTRVVLPEPFGPIMAATDPAGIENETSLTTFCPPKETVHPTMETAGGLLLVFGNDFGISKHGFDVGSMVSGSTQWVKDRNLFLIIINKKMYGVCWCFL